MIRLNNKGQSLVLFVVIIPLLFLILTLVVDVGNVLVTKQQLDNLIYLTVDYGIDHINEFDIEDKMEDMILKNNSNIDNIEIVINDEKVTLVIKKKINGTLAKNVNLIEIESKYNGYIENGKKIIERV